MQPLDKSPLGHGSTVPAAYAPELLFAVARRDGRASLGIEGDLPFHGEDIWNAYEVSWLGPRGLPRARLAELRFRAGSDNIVESKSLKLYLNSLNNTRFESDDALRETVQRDLGAASGAAVDVTLHALSAGALPLTGAFDGWCIDDDSVDVDAYEVEPRLLAGSARKGAPLCATVYSDLLRSCCPVTGQPDWASVMLRYEGRWIDHAALLRYLVSFRNNAEFHEQCVERIFMDVQRHCAPDKLTVYARYTRRGGLDINPFRSNFEPTPPNLRHPRQ